MKKLLVIIALFGLFLTLTACGNSKKVYTAYEFTQMTKSSQQTELTPKDQLRQLKSYSIVLYSKSSTFEVIEESNDGSVQKYTGTYERKANLDGKETITFSYSDQFNKNLENLFGKEVYEVRNNGKELYLYQDINKVSGDVTLGPITKKLRLK